MGDFLVSTSFANSYVVFVDFCGDNILLLLVSPVMLLSTRFFSFSVIFLSPPLSYFSFFELSTDWFTFWEFGLDTTFCKLSLKFYFFLLALSGFSSSNTLPSILPTFLDRSCAEFTWELKVYSMSLDSCTPTLLNLSGVMLLDLFCSRIFLFSSYALMVDSVFDCFEISTGFILCRPNSRSGSLDFFSSGAEWTESRDTSS